MPDQQEKTPTDAMYVDGVAVTLDSLSFEEQDQVHKILSELGDHVLELQDAPLRHFLPALYTVVKRRKEPDYRLENAMALTPDDIFAAPPTEDAEEREQSDESPAPQLTSVGLDE
jgi:hypothetical protein